MSYWFRPKHYGYGATPNTWQGWLMTLAFVGLLAGILEFVGPARPLAIAAAVILAVLFIWITWKKTDGAWRWRWGSREKER
jgi:hypothetical protein